MTLGYHELEMQIAVQRSCPVRRWSYVAMERIHEDGQLMLGEPQRPTPEGMIFEPLLRSLRMCPCRV